MLSIPKTFFYKKINQILKPLHKKTQLTIQAFLYNLFKRFCSKLTSKYSFS